MSPAKREPTTEPDAAAEAQLNGHGASAQGRQARAAGSRAVIIDGDNRAPINTGDVYQTIINQAARPGADATQLRNAYLAWLSLRANELPLFADASGRQAQLAAVYTALLTQGRDFGRQQPKAGDDAAARMLDRDPRPQSALEALDAEPHMVLMGGPGGGKTTFLNYVALCMAGELLGLDSANLDRLRTPIPPDPDDAPGKEPPQPQRWGRQALLPVRVLLRDFAAALPPAGTELTADALWGFIVKQMPALLQPFAEHLQAELLGSGGLILLDGLDEVPDALQRREQVKAAIQQFAGVHRACRFLVTSRTYAYQRQDWKLDGFAERELLPFSRGQIERFIDTWYAHMARDLFRLTEQDAAGRAEVLKRATRRPELRELAQRPLLLTLMARLQTKTGGSLPENREALYAESVDMLLDEWEGLKLGSDANGQPVVREPSLSEWLNAPRENIRRELDRLAYQVHREQPSLVGTADIRGDDLTAALKAASREHPDTRFLRLEEYLRDRAGLLASHGEGLYQFPHRSFQEYLAACHLSRCDFPDTISALMRSDPNRWREVALLAAARAKDTPSAVWEWVEELCAKDRAPAEDAPEPDLPSQWGALLAAAILAEIGLAEPNPELRERHERKRRRVRDWQPRLLRSSLLPARERALAGDLLARLGDPRRHLLDVDAMRFCAVPGGAFWMGDERDRDTLLHRNEALGYDYWIAQTPVTVAQFRQFVASGPDQSPDPDRWRRQPENGPVVYVTWQQARAFCVWLTKRWRGRLPAGWEVTLPSEAEWEKAARGGEQIPAQVCVMSLEQGRCAVPADLIENPLPRRAYPWWEGKVSDNANVGETIGSVSTPGCFATGRSVYGCDDMAGNVWEWTRSLWGKDFMTPEFGYPYDPGDGRREALGAEEQVYRVARGGSWFSTELLARCAYRLRLHPGFRSDFLGFRVLLRAAPVP